MTPNLPLSLALFIPTKDHPEAEKALIAHVEQIVAARRQQWETALLDHVRANVDASNMHNLERSTGETIKQEKPLTRIPSGGRGEYHEKYVATFRSRFPNGQDELRCILNSYPPGTMLTVTQVGEIKARFTIDGRSLLLPAMLRELGCREDRTGRWITPVARIAMTGGF